MVFNYARGEGDSQPLKQISGKWANVLTAIRIVFRSGRHQFCPCRSGNSCPRVISTSLLKSYHVCERFML
jgi:hypothetical protein